MRLASLVEQLPERSARGIAVGIGHLVRSGALRPGDRLPTVRMLAAELGVSPTTVAEAWRLLGSAQVIETRGKLGTVVRGGGRPPGTQRVLRGPSYVGYPLDLRLAVPDPALLPDPRAAVAAMAQIPELNEYPGTALLPALRELQQAEWPFPPEQMLAVSGGYDGVHLLCAALLRPGERVVVETLTSGRFLDILDALRVEAVPVAVDEFGPRPEAVAAALDARPVALLYQPRAQSPTGAALDGARAEQLAAALRDSDVAVIEDDPMCALSSQPARSLGRWHPDRTVVVRNWSKSHGPDLRVGLVGGAAKLVGAAEAARSLGAEWTSRLLQGALLHMLTDPASRALVARAATTYRQRRERLAAALAARGVPTTARDGLSLWVPVADEHAALVGLAVHGIGAGAGSLFTARPLQVPHLRVTTSRLTTRVEEVADLLAAEAPQPTRRHKTLI